MKPVSPKLVMGVAALLVFLAAYGLYTGVRRSAPRFPQAAPAGAAATPGFNQAVAATDAQPFVEPPPPSAAPPAPPKPKPAPDESSAPASDVLPPSSAPAAAKPPAPPKPPPASAQPDPSTTELDELY